MHFKLRIDRVKADKINPKEQYEKSLQRFEKIFLAKSNTKEGKEAQLLASILKDFEDRHFKIESSTPTQSS